MVGRQRNRAKDWLHRQAAQAARAPRGLRTAALVLVVAVALLGAATLTLVTTDSPRRPPPPKHHITGSLAATQQSCPWLNNQLPVATRVNELLKAMTPYEEASLLHLLSANPSGSSYEGYIPAIPSLCIPEITEQDGAAGVATGYTTNDAAFPDVTQLPAPIADAAAFDPALAHSYGDVIGAEDADKGIGLALSPTINIDRSPLWGRSYETLGEDPFLTATLAVQLVQGIQQNRVVTVVKHFAVYNQETNRATALDDSIVSDRAMHEIYLPAWSAAVQQGHAGAVMCSYNLINGVPACQDVNLLDTILVGQWHFAGFIRSDCGSVYDQAATMAAGVSQVKCTPLYDPTQVARAVADRELARSELDGLAKPLLTVLFQFDLIANPHPLTPDQLASTPAHRAVAEQTNEEGAVLLKNSGGVLPLDLANLSSVALIGPHDATPSPAGLGAMHVLASDPVDAEGAFEQVLGPRLHYYDGVNPAVAADLARRSQVAIVVVYDEEAERHDRSSLSLPGDQNTLIADVAAANPRTIVVLETGSAVLMPWLKSVPAVLETWYPGETAGTSLVRLLDGAVDPSGKLPVTFPTAQSPDAMPDDTAATFGGVDGKVNYSDGIDVGYRWYEEKGVQPLFPFGFGLSYTQFAFSGLSATPTSSGAINVKATVANVGAVKGADVVQCYVGLPASSGEPARQLRGFTRVTLAPGQKTTINLTLSPGDLATYSSATGWNVPAGAFRIYAGDGSDIANLPLSTTVALHGASLGFNSGPAS
ncbi:MAG: glycoside hydrolase family 3 C-terminal domain-containing protein [Acidimicrobiales bacterium]